MHSLHFTLVLIAHASVAGADATPAVQPLAPVLHDLGVIAKDDAACLNDPTQGVFVIVVCVRVCVRCCSCFLVDR